MSRVKKRVLLVGHSDADITPLCVAVLTCMIQKKHLGEIQFRSCGFWAKTGQKANKMTVTVAGEIGLDLNGYRANAVTDELLNWADLILPQDEMIAKGLQQVLHKNCKKMGKAMKLGVSAGGTLEDYRQAREQVMAFGNRLMRKLMTEVRELKKQTAQVTYQAITPDHVSAVAHLEQACFSHPWSENAVLSELEKTDGCFVGAFLYEQLIGYGSLSLVCDVGYINNIAVEQSYRRLGIGAQLLNHLEAYCVQNNAQSITLEVRSRNKGAIALYEKHGFIPCGLRKGFYRSPSDDGLIMTKELSLHRE